MKMLKFSLVMLVVVTLFLSVSFLDNQADATKSKGTFLLRTMASEICGDWVCSSSMSHSEKIKAYLYGDKTGNVLQQEFSEFGFSPPSSQKPKGSLLIPGSFFPADKTFGLTTLEESDRVFIAKYGYSPSEEMEKFSVPPISSSVDLRGSADAGNFAFQNPAGLSFGSARDVIVNIPKSETPETPVEEHFQFYLHRDRL